MYLRYLVKIKHHISYFCNALLEYCPLQLHQAWCETKFIKYRENKLTVQNVRHWHEHKHASLLIIGQLHHQSATAPSLATHAADAVTAHQCHERNSDVIFVTRERNNFKQIPYRLQVAFIPCVKIIKIHQGFPELCSQMYCDVFYESRCMNINTKSQIPLR